VPIYDPGPAPPLAPWIAIAGCVLFFMICAMGIYICHRSANCPPWLMETLDVSPCLSCAPNPPSRIMLRTGLRRTALPRRQRRPGLSRGEVAFEPENICGFQGLLPGKAPCGCGIVQGFASG
jgi:hypothetical protein